MVIPETESVIPQGASNYFQVGAEGVMKFSEKTNSNSLQFAKLQSTKPFDEEGHFRKSSESQWGTVNGETNKQKSLEQNFITIFFLLSLANKVCGSACQDLNAGTGS